MVLDYELVESTALTFSSDTKPVDISYSSIHILVILRLFDLISCATSIENSNVHNSKSCAELTQFPVISKNT